MQCIMRYNAVYSFESLTVSDKFGMSGKTAKFILIFNFSLRFFTESPLWSVRCMHIGSVVDV
jgi:hypothetical protein